MFLKIVDTESENIVQANTTKHYVIMFPFYGSVNTLMIQFWKCCPLRCQLRWSKIRIPWDSQLHGSVGPSHTSRYICIPNSSQNFIGVPMALGESSHSMLALEKARQWPKTWDIPDTHASSSMIFQSCPIHRVLQRLARHNLIHFVSFT